MKVLERNRFFLWSAAVVLPVLIPIGTFFLHLKTRKLHLMCGEGTGVADCFYGDGLSFVFMGLIGYIAKAYGVYFLVCLGALVLVEIAIALNKRRRI